MDKRLPARPNLEHLRTQAKALLAKLREGDSEAAKTLAKHLPEAAKLTPEQIRSHGFRLADAQAAIARKSGFTAWPGLARHVDRLRNMEGTWSYRLLEIDGEAMPAAMLANSQLLIDGDRFRMESPEAVYEGIFNIDVETMPCRIDIDFVEGPEAGNRCEGLFELDGDQFTICLGLAGSTRPESFVTSKGSGHALERLVRVVHARPAGVEGGTHQPVTPTPHLPVVEEKDFETALTPSLEMLQGEWLPVELITSGKPLQAAYLAYGSRIQNGVETKVVFGGQTMVHAKVRINETPHPVKEIDYLNLIGRTKGSVSRGLFQMDGGEAVFCMAVPGGNRPDGFTCLPESGWTLSRWKRKVP